MTPTATRVRTGSVRDATVLVGFRAARMPTRRLGPNAATVVSRPSLWTTTAPLLAATRLCENARDHSESPGGPALPPSTASRNSGPKLHRYNHCFEVNARIRRAPGGFHQESVHDPIL